MANNYGIPEEIEKRIRDRDKKCVYCHKDMIYPCVGENKRDWATIEHLCESPPFYWNDGLKEEGLAICCASCNSSRGKMKITDWFKTSYCAANNINDETVAKPVQIYIKTNEK